MSEFVDMLSPRPEAPAAPPQNPMAVPQQPDPMQAQQAGVTPPANEQELQARVSKWQEFQNRVRDDPAFRFSLLHGAVALMQPIQPGQTATGHVAQAFGVGQQAYALANSQNQKDALAQREMTAKEQETASASDLRGAQAGQARAATETEPVRRAQLQASTDQTRAQTAEINQTLPVKLNMLNAQIKGVNSTASYHDAMTTLTKAKADVELLTGVERERAETSLRQAQAGLATAQAEYARQHAAVIGAQLQAEKGWTTSAPKVNEDGTIMIASTNKTSGEKQIVVTHPRMDQSQAIARARTELKAVDSMTPGQVFGTSAERLAAYGRLVGEPVKSAEEALTKLATRYTKGGVYTTRIDAKGMASTVSSPEMELQAPTPGNETRPGASVDATMSVPTAVKTHPAFSSGVSTTLTLDNQEVWRVDGRGGATKIGGASTPATRPAPSAAPATRAAPEMSAGDRALAVAGARDRGNLNSDATVIQLRRAIADAGRAGDTARAQQLSAQLTQYINGAYQK